MTAAFQAWVCARLEAPNQELCHFIAQKAKSSVAEFAELDVTPSQIFKSFQVNPMEAFLVTLVKQSQVTHLCWSLAKMDQVDLELFDLLADHAVQMGFVRRFSAQMASQLAWAFATAKVKHVPLLEALDSYVVKSAAHVEQQAEG